MHRRVPARGDRRVADPRVRHEVAELDLLRAIGDERERRVGLLPEDVRVVGPAVLEPVQLCLLGELDQAGVGRVGQNGDAEREHVTSGWARGRETVIFARIPPRGNLALPAFGFAAGAMLPIQFGINAQLASWVDSPLRATLVSFAVGTLVLFLVMLVAVPGLAGALDGSRPRRGGSGSAGCSARSTCSAASSRRRSSARRRSWP